MTAFVISINGRQVWTAGIGSRGVLGASVSWIGMDASPDGMPAEVCVAHVGGHDQHTDEHVNWTMPLLAPGDVVTIAIVEADRVDPPTGRYASGDPDAG
jgi:hypothetical protein